MQPHEAEKQLATIRRIMESATQLTVLPGKAAVIGGLIALVGCAVSYWQVGSLDFGQVNDIEASMRWRLIGVWAAVAVLGVAIDVLMTVRLARKHGEAPWSRLSQLAAYAMGPGIAAGIALTIALARNHQWQMVPGIWMMLYGGAVWTASVMSMRAPSVLGLAFFLVGLVTLFWAASVSLAMIALTFGFGHVIFGIYLIAKFGD